ncbi:MAG: SBBP repeat-containing protein [Fimbriimonas sp.]
MQIKLTSIVTAGFLLATFAHSAPVIDWTTTWSEGGAGISRPVFVKLDGDGNILTAGHILGSTGFDLLVQKRNSVGVLLWTATYDNPRRDDAPKAMGLDGEGNVIVAGTSWAGVGFERWLVLKVTSEGSIAWTRSADVGGANAMHVNADGTCIVGGYTTSPSTAFDMCTIKYAANGTRLWTSRLNGPHDSDDYVEDVAVDSSGNIYVAGSVQKSETQRDTRVFKLNSSGARLWTRSYSAPSLNSLGVKIAVHPNGGCIVAGEQYQQAVESTYDVPVSRYDADGNLIWRRIFNSPYDRVERVKGLKIDNAGNAWLLLAAHTDTSRDDIMLVRYSPTGVKDARRFANGDGMSDEPMGFALNPTDGTIYIAGGTTNIYNKTESLVLKYNSLTRVWTSIQAGPNNGDFAFDVAIDSQNRAIVSGQTDIESNIMSRIWRIH